MDYGKRALSLLLTLAMLLTLPLAAPGEARAVSWIPPEEPAALFRIDAALYTRDADGGYYEITERMAAERDELYYTVRLELPSVAEANAYYGNSGFFEGGRVGVLLEYRGCAGLSERLVQVPLTSEPQTLWFNGNEFTAVWQESLKEPAADCTETEFDAIGCAQAHMQPLVRATEGVTPKVRAGIYTYGDLSNVPAGSYYPREQGFVHDGQRDYGMLLERSAVSHDYDVFFPTNDEGRVTGAYIVDNNYEDIYYGAFGEVYADDLYAWRVTGTYDAGCLDSSCQPLPAFSLQRLSASAVLDESGGELRLADSEQNNLAWMCNGAPLSDALNSSATLSDGNSSDALASAFARWLSDGNFPGSVEGPQDASALFKVYTYRNGTYSVQSSPYLNGQTVYARAQNGYTDDESVTFSISSSISGGLSSDGMVSGSIRYGWRITGTYTANCQTGACEARPYFSLELLPADVVLDMSAGYPQLDAGTASNLAWMCNGHDLDAAALSQAFSQWLADGHSGRTYGPQDASALWRTYMLYGSGIYSVQTASTGDGADTLYGWRVSGAYNADCQSVDCFNRPAFSLQALPESAAIVYSGNIPMLDAGAQSNLDWIRNGLDLDDAALSQAFNQWLADGQHPSNVYGPAEASALYRIYTLGGGEYSVQNGPSRADYFTGYPYTGTLYVYGDTYIFGGNNIDARIFQQTSNTTVNCDTNEAAYLNALNGTYAQLGFSYADIAAGQVYLSDGFFISNFAPGGTLEDVRVGNSSVSHKGYYGFIPCVNCQPETLEGYLLTGAYRSGTLYNAFFSTDAQGRATGLYLFDAAASTPFSHTAMEPYNETLYGWAKDGDGFVLAALPPEALLNPSFRTWQNSHDSSGFAAWCKDGGSYAGETPDALDWTLVYLRDAAGYVKIEEHPERLPFLPLKTALYANAPLPAAGEPAVRVSQTAQSVGESSGHVYETGSAYRYGNIYLSRSYAMASDGAFLPATVAIASDGAVGIPQTTEAVLGLFGMDYADLEAGDHPMSPHYLLEKYGLYSSIYDVAPAFYLIGDVNLDGKRDLSDVVLLARYLVQSETFTSLQLSLADVDGKAGVNVHDVVFYCGALVGREKLPAA